MNQPLIERVARLLAEKGPLSTKALSMHLGETVERISESTRQARSMGRYGLSIVGREPGIGRGKPTKILAVDVRALQRYLELRGPYVPTVKITRKEVHETPLKAKPKRAKPPTPKEPKVIYGRKSPVYHGLHRTVWQPTSPYYKGAANEHDRLAPSAPVLQQPSHS